MPNNAAQYMEAFRRNLAELVHKTRLSQKDFACMAGLPESTVSRLLSGQAKDIELKTLHKLATALKVPIARLLSEEAPLPSLQRPPTWEEVVWVLNSLLASPHGREIVDSLVSREKSVPTKTKKD